MTDVKNKYVTVEANSKEDLEKRCIELNIGYIIIDRGIIKSQYDKDLKYKQTFIIMKTDT